MIDNPELPAMQWLNANTGESISMIDLEIIKFRQGNPGVLLGVL